jgi:hypothetical protein
MFEASKPVTIEAESRSEAPACGTVYALYILTTFYHMHHCHYAATGDMVKSFIMSPVAIYFSVVIR